MYPVLPQLGNIKKVEVVVPSVKGEIEVSLADSVEAFNLSLTSPPLTKAVVGIPKDYSKKIKSITVNGHEVWENGCTKKLVNGISYKIEDKNYYRFTVSPGKWDFKATYMEENKKI